MTEKRFKIYQDSIRKFESNRIYGVKSNTVCLEPYMTFKEAEKCCELLNEQQATIRRLQDLCGKSDYENAKLREEVNLLRPTNLEQYEQIQKLQEENEQLQAQLREKEQDEQLYANEIVKLNKEAKEVLDFKSLGGDY